MMKLLKREPVLTVAVLQAVLALLAAFGVDLSPEAQAGLGGLLAALLALSRGTVTPNAKVNEAVDLAAQVAAESVARQITPEIAGPAGQIGADALDAVDGAIRTANAAVRY